MFPKASVRLALPLTFFVAVAATAADRQWVGTTPNWSLAANWSPAGAPAGGDTLIFLSTAPAVVKSPVNDLPAFGIPLSLEVRSGYSVSGNGVLASAVEIRGGASLTTPLRVNGSSSFRIVENFPGTATLAAPIDMNVGSLRLHGTRGSSVTGTIDGTGSILSTQESELTLTGGGSLSGTYTLNGGAELTLAGDYPGMNVAITTGGTQIHPTALFGNGRIGHFEAFGGIIAPAGPGSIATNGASLNQTRAEFDVFAGGSSQLSVIGGVGIQSSSLRLNVAGAGAPGTTYTVIDNDGTDPIGGAFLEYPEGSVYTSGTTYLRVSYIGGTGNDMTLTVVTSACTYSISPTSTNAPAGGTSGTVAVTTPVGCTWSSSSSLSWASASGSGDESGTATYTVSPNPGLTARSGTVTIAGQSFTIIQAGLTCTYSLNPTTFSTDSRPGMQQVAVTAPNGCTWTAASNSPWLTITSGASGNGDGTVTFAIGANDSGASRSGSLTIGGQTVGVTQDSCQSPVPVQLAPASGSTVDTPVRFTWAPATGATTYNVWVTNAAGALKLAATTGDTSAVVALDPGPYTWFIEAVSTTCAPAFTGRGAFTVVDMSRRRAARH